MDGVNVVLYSALQFEYNKAFRRKHRIKVQHLQILQLLYYFHSKPPKGAIKATIRELLSLHMTPYLNGLYDDLLERGMIEYYKKDWVYVIRLLPHIREELSVLYDERNIIAFIEEKIKGF